MRFDDLVRSERYFTATLLPLLLFHNKMDGVQRFVELVDKKATTEYNEFGKQDPKGTPEYNKFDDVEVITEFHIARDLEFAGLSPDVTAWRRDGGGVPADEPPGEARDVGSSGESEATRCAPDLVIAAGQELVVCEGKFFNGFNTKALNEQLRSQRHEVRRLFFKRPSIRAYRHVAILPEKAPVLREGLDLTNAIDADAVITWDNIRELAETLMGSHHYVTDRLREAVRRYDGDDGEGSWDGQESFENMRRKCRKSGSEILVGYVGGEPALLKLSLVQAEQRQWRWRNRENKGKMKRTNWLPGTHWLEIVESARGFGGGGA